MASRRGSHQEEARKGAAAVARSGAGALGSALSHYHQGRKPRRETTGIDPREGCNSQLCAQPRGLILGGSFWCRSSRRARLLEIATRSKRQYRARVARKSPRSDEELRPTRARWRNIGHHVEARRQSIRHGGATRRSARRASEEPARGPQPAVAPGASPRFRRSTRLVDRDEDEIKRDVDVQRETRSRKERDAPFADRGAPSQRTTQCRCYRAGRGGDVIVKNR